LFAISKSMNCTRKKNRSSIKMLFNFKSQHVTSRECRCSSTINLWKSRSTISFLIKEILWCWRCRSFNDKYFINKKNREFFWTFIIKTMCFFHDDQRSSFVRWDKLCLHVNAFSWFKSFDEFDSITSFFDDCVFLFIVIREISCEHKSRQCSHL
jgi:hypothetical protein